MDRFKFRVWVESSGELITDLVGFVVDPNKQKLRYFRINDCMKDGIGTAVLKLVDCTVEQCTGLKDKNGKLIWEGDVMKIYIKHEWAGVGVIVWKDEDAGFFHTWQEVMSRRVTECHRPPKKLWLNHDCELEVVGNIHENANLLE